VGGRSSPRLFLDHEQWLDAKPDDPLFTETHREGIEELLAKADLGTDADGCTRDAKSLRQTGISLRLDLGPNPDYRDIAKWARTSPAVTRPSTKGVVQFQKFSITCMIRISQSWRLSLPLASDHVGGNPRATIIAAER
jgi:hypothetical protein